MAALQACSTGTACQLQRCICKGHQRSKGLMGRSHAVRCGQQGWHRESDKMESGTAAGLCVPGYVIRMPLLAKSPSVTPRGARTDCRHAGQFRHLRGRRPLRGTVGRRGCGDEWWRAGDVEQRREALPQCTAGTSGCNVGFTAAEWKEWGILWVRRHTKCQYVVTLVRCGCGGITVSHCEMAGTELSTQIRNDGSSHGPPRDNGEL